jgi:ATP-dependent DNA helicase RecQ
MTRVDESRANERTADAEAVLKQARQALKQYFGYDDFRGAQPDAIRAIAWGRDVLVLMPTGGGKSLCFQMPALVLPGLTLVVSPLISLMQDQVDALTRRGIAATYINSTLSPSESASRMASVQRGDIKLLYVAPERFDSHTFRRVLPRLEVSLLAVDEAHCISEWGGRSPATTCRILCRKCCRSLAVDADPGETSCDVLVEVAILPLGRGD